MEKPLFFVSLSHLDSMKRFLLLLIGLTSLSIASAQFRFTTYFSAKPIVAVTNPSLYGEMSLLFAPVPNQTINADNVYFIRTTTNSAREDLFQLLVGTDAETALKTIRELRLLTRKPVGTMDTISNAETICHLKVKSFKKSGKVVEMRNEGVLGVVRVDDFTLSMMEDALEHFSEERGSSFYKENPSDRLSAKSEINRYRQYLNICKPSPNRIAYYTDSYQKLFKKRIRQYRKDLRRL